MAGPSSSLFSRLIVRVAVVLGVGAACLVTAAQFYARAAADDAYDRLLLGAAFQMSDGLVFVDGAFRFELPPSAFDLLGLAARDRIFYRVIGPGGATLTGYDDLGPDIQLARSRSGPLLQNAVYRGEAVRIVTVARAVTWTDGPGWTHVMVAQTTEARRALAAEITSRAVLLVLVMSLLALGGTALAVRYSLRPVADLGALLGGRDPQDLTPIGSSAPRELVPFVTSINHFIRRLDERVKLLQRYVADSAHQVRTPLTAPSAQLSLIDEERLSPADRKHLDRARDRTAELARLVNQLLSHAMVIHRFDSAQLQPVELNSVAREAFRAAVPITVDPELVVSFEASEENPVVLGDVLSLRESIVNLIDNALRHGAKSRLDVRVERHGDRGMVLVEDDGPGIPPAEWDNLTRRFFTARSDGAVSGLGFAIASEVATALGGTIGFRERTRDSRFGAYLELPLIEGRPE